MVITNIHKTMFHGMPNGMGLNFASQGQTRNINPGCQFSPFFPIIEFRIFTYNTVKMVMHRWFNELYSDFWWQDHSSLEMQPVITKMFKHITANIVEQNIFNVKCSILG